MGEPVLRGRWASPYSLGEPVLGEPVLSLHARSALCLLGASKVPAWLPSAHLKQWPSATCTVALHSTFTVAPSPATCTVAATFTVAPNTRHDSVRLLVLVGVTFPQDRAHSKKNMHVMQNHVMQKPCKTMSCKIMQNHVVQCHAKSCYAKSCKIMSCEQMSYKITPSKCHAKTMQNRAKQAKLHIRRTRVALMPGRRGRASMPGKWR